MWARELADVLRDAGLTVKESPGWQRLGHGPLKDVRGVMLHHTAGSAPYDRTIVIDGRPGLPGPLANLYLDPDGVWWAVAAGRAYHAGQGGPWGSVPKDQGNDYILGVEVSSLGQGDITGAQYDAMVAGSAALVAAYGLTPAHVLTHKDWTPRKIDIRNPVGVVRTDVAAALNPTPDPDPAEPLPTEGDKSMILQSPTGSYWLLHGGHVVSLDAGSALNARAGGMPMWKVATSVAWDNVVRSFPPVSA